MHMQRGWKVAVIVALAFGLTVAAGCQSIADKAAETAVEKATGVKVDTKGEKVTISTDEGEATISSDAKLPDDFPSDVPIYDDAKIGTAMTNEVQGGKSYLVGMESDDDAAEVFDWYKKAFEDEGWKITSTMEVGDSVGGLSAEKGDVRVSLAIGYGAEKKADISLTVTPKQ